MAIVNAHVVKLSYGGSAIDFTSGSHKVLEYTPRAPDLSTIDSNSILHDGGERPITTFRNVTETARILMSNTSIAAIQAGKHEIQRMFGLAMHKQRLGAGSPVYLIFQPSNTASEWRSEVLSGKIELVPDMLNQRWDTGDVEAILSWTRRYYWEGDLLGATIINPRGTSTGSLRIDNSYDPGNTRYNWVSIAASSVVGEVNTPAKLILRNKDGVSNSPKDIFIFHNTFQDGNASLVPTTSSAYGADFEYTGSKYTASVVADATNQGGKYTKYAVSNTFNIFEDVTGIKYIGGSLQAFGGRNFAIMMRTHSLVGTTASIYAQFKMMYKASDNTLATMYEGPEVRLSASAKLHHLGSVKIPPVLDGTYSDDIYGILWVKTDTLFTLELNYLMAMPADNVRVLKMIDRLWPDDSILMSNDIIENYYMQQDDNVSRRGTVAVTGNKIMLVPDMKQELFFLMSEGSIMNVTRQARATVEYRPRVLTI